MRRKSGRKCKVCQSRLRNEIERLVLEGKLGYRMISRWVENQGEDLTKDNIYQHHKRHMIGMEDSVKVSRTMARKDGRSSQKVEKDLGYHAMLRDLIGKIYQKIDIDQLKESDMLKILHLLARLTDLISKVEIRKIEGSAVVSKLLEARAEGRFEGWIEGEEVKPKEIEEGEK